MDAPPAEPVVLRDGTSAWLRPARPEDVERLTQLFERASAQSRLLRFFTPLRHVDPHLIEELAAADGDERAAYVVTHGAGRAEAIAAVGNYSRLPPGDSAEVAFFVDDAEQGKGMGTLLLERLALHARSRGIRCLRADVLTINEAMLAVFRDSGLVTEARPEGDTILVTLGAQPGAAATERADARAQTATVASLAPFFRPRAVAVIGASREPHSVGRIVFDELLRAGFAGPVFPINPTARSIGSVKAYPNVLAVPDDLDLAVIAVPADRVLQAVEDCATKRVRALVILSAGFAETGAEGRELQDELLYRVRSQGMRLIGPNCIGLLNTDEHVRLNASFSPIFPRRGSVAIASQSGALGVAVLDFAQELALGVSTFASIGNRADVSGNDLLEYWESDPDARVILLYLESFGNARRFARIARRVARQKPILAVKAGRSAAGSKAARSHTAALASDDRSADALFHQAGVIRATSLQELFDVASLLASQPLPPGRRVSIVTNAGGPAILCADACAAQGLQLAIFDAKTEAALKQILPAAAATGNPVDMIASATAEQYRAVVELVLTDPNVDAMIAIHTPVQFAQTEAVGLALASAVASARRSGAAGKPVVSCFTTPRALGTPASGDAEETIPSFRFPEPPARALALAARYAEWRRRPLDQVRTPANADADGVRALLDSIGRGDHWLGPDPCAELLRCAGIRLAAARLVHTADEAAAAAAALGYPVALKIASQRYLHKSDVGGVLLGLEGEQALRDGCGDLERSFGSNLEGFLVQKMAGGGVEVLVGVTADLDLGPLIGFGLGGTTAELLNDAVFRITPLTDVDAQEMIQGLRGHALLEGYRGRPAADIPALEDLLLRVSWLVEAAPEIVEMDLNPVMALPAGSGVIVLDARIRVHAGS